MQELAVPAFIAVVLAFVAFRQWLGHEERLMIHRERVIALEKGLEPPAWPDVRQSRGLGAHRVLLLSGLIWLALGVGGIIAAYVIVPNLTIPDAPPRSIWLMGLAPALVGVAQTGGADSAAQSWSDVVRSHA
jgi:hypothetical protein